MAGGLGLTIKIGADTAGAIQGINRVNSALGDKLTGPEKFKAAIDRAFVPAIAALGALSVAGLAAVKAAEEAAVANARLGQVFSQMGYAEATDRVIAYADALSTQIAVEDEVIKATQARLATFNEVAKTANEVGGAFDRATVAAFDLAAAGFGSAETNAIQLGKALQDPVKGITALARSGVTFTAAEKERIAALVKSNKMGEAQALILAAIEKQVGGTAAATAKGSDKMAIAFGEIAEAVGMLLLPAFEVLTPLVIKFAGTMQENAPAILAVAGAVGVLAAAVVAAKVGIAVYQAAVTIATAATWLWNSALFKNPIGVVVLAIIALVAAIVLAYNNIEGFRNAVDAAWAFIKQAISAVVDWFQNTAWPIIQRVVDFIVAYFQLLFTVTKATWNALYAAVENVVRWFQDSAWPIIRRVIDFMVGYFRFLFTVGKATWNGLYAAVETVVSWFTGTALPAVRRFTDLVGQVFNTMKDAVGRAWAAVRDAIQGVVEWLNSNLIGRIRAALTAVVAAFQAIVGRIVEVGREIVEGLWRGIQGGWSFLTERVRGLASSLVEGVKDVFQIRSPSRVFMEIGGNVVEGFRIGLSGLDGLAEDTAKKVEAFATSAEGRLNAIADRARALRDAYAALKGEISGNITEVVSLDEAWRSVDGSAGSWLEYLKKQALDAGDFAAALEHLKDSGASQALIDQVRMMGPGAGTALADDMIAKGLIPEVNRLLKQTKILGDDTGAYIADAFYGPGSKAGQKLLQALDDQIKADKKALRDLGEKIGVELSLGLSRSTRAWFSWSRSSGSGVTYSETDLLAGAGNVVAMRRAPVGGVNITVNGALDPPAVAKQIRRILKGAEVRDRAGGGVLSATIEGVA